jgi:nucleotide-binding universal stress UspA family protein
MFKRILVPVDGSETSTRALVAAVQMARESGGRVRAMHALDELAYVSGYDYGADLMRIAHDQAEKVVREAIEVAKGSGVPCDSRLVEAPGRRLGDIVAEEAVAWGADLVVVGTHGRRGLGRVLLGSGAEQVIRSAPVPVLVFRDRDPEEVGLLKGD